MFYNRETGKRPPASPVLDRRGLASIHNDQAREIAVTFHHYHPYYCEENIWHLCNKPGPAGRGGKAVFISNPQRSCPIWSAVAAPSAGLPLFWDYHVIYFGKQAHPRAWDPDSRLAPGTPLSEYLRASFPISLPRSFRPLFRIVDAEFFLAEFSSDRHHMRRPDGSWLHPPPPWPLIQNGVAHNLHRWIDMEHEYHGVVLDLEAMTAVSRQVFYAEGSPGPTLL